MAFCNVCRDLEFSPEWLATGGHRRSKDVEEPFIKFDYPSIRAGAETCLSCALVRDVADRYIPANVISSIKMKLGYHHTLTLWTEYAEESGWWGHPSRGFQIYKLNGTWTPWKCISDRDIVTGNTGDSTCLEWVKDAIRECGEEDERCSASTDAELPTRIIDIGSHETENDIETVTLLESGGQRGRYACLSHCWGQDHIITTTTQTIDERRNGIRMTALPKTFQDAIIFTYRLGLRYLWIDSLCILQDSPTDWLHESQSMARVYSNCTICLAATMSSSGTGGLFRSDPVPISSFSSTSYLFPSSSSIAPWQVFARPSIPHDAISEYPNLPGYWNVPMHGVAPLLTRAWVFQERILSPRFLQFLGQELMLECRTGVRCMCGCQRDRVFSPGFGEKHELEKKIAGGNEAEIARAWRTAVAAYTGLCITKETDRLPAIQGLADYMGRFRRGRYLKGIWEEGLFEELAWMVNRPAETRPEPMTAPTWSWGSVNAVITPQCRENLRVEPHCQLVGVDVPRVGEAPDGRKMALVLSGMVSEATMEYSWGFYLKPKIIILCGGTEMEVFKEDYAIWRPGRWHVPSGSAVFCLPLATMTMYEGHLGIFYHLVLRKLESGGYERIGLLCRSLSDGPEVRAPDVKEMVVNLV